jgi:hypothetical protein
MAKLPRYTRRDFQFTASAIESALRALSAVAVDDRQRETLRRAVAVVATAFALRFKESNPLFREGQFLEACGLRWPDDFDRSPFHYLESRDSFWQASWRWLSEAESD